MQEQEQDNPSIFNGIKVGELFSTPGSRSILLSIIINLFFMIEVKFYLSQAIEKGKMHRDVKDKP